MQQRNPVKATKRRLLSATLLASCLFTTASLGGAGGQTEASTSSRPRQMTEEQAKQLRIEANRDFAVGMHAEALPKYLRLYQEYPNDFEVNYRIGWLYLNGPAAEWQQALSFLRRAHRAKPGDLNAMQDLAKASAWARLPEAVSLYRDLVRLAPNVLNYRLELARALAWSGQTAEASKTYIDYLGRAPSSFAARVELGQLLSQQKDFPGAAEQYNYVLRFQPRNTAARLGLAQVLAWSGQMRLSLAELASILKARPDHFDALTLKAYDHLWLGELDQAKATFSALAKRDPKNKDVQEGLKSVAKLQAKGGTPSQPATAPERSAFLASAEAEEAQGEYGEAIVQYRKHLEQNPKDGDARFRLARVLGWNRQFSESEAMLRDWVQEFPDNPEGYFQLARVLSWDQKYQEAAQQFRKGLAIRPQEARAHIDLASTLSWIKEYSQASDEYRTALTIEPKSPDALAGYAQTLIWDGQPDAARGQVTQLRQVSPDHPQLSALDEQLASLQARQEQTQATEGGKPEEYFRKVLQKDPGNIPARVELADLYASRKDYPAAIQELRKASELKPEDDALRLRLARTLSWNQEYAEAERLFQDWLTRHPEDQAVRLEFARMLSWGRNYDASRAQYEEILRDDPENREASQELARVLSWAKQYDASAGHYAELLKKDPENTTAQLELARVLSWSKRYPESLRAYDAVLRQDAKNYDAWVGKGRVNSYQSRWPEARQAFDEALSARPGDPEALTGKAQVILWSGDPGAAREMLSKLHAENPSDTTVLLSMASAENSLGRPDRALNLLDQAEKLEPRNTEVQGLRQQIQAGLRPELRIGWSYVRDNESLNIWRYQLLDFRFNLHPRLRNFVTVDVLPSSARADLFGYAVETSSGLMFATRVPVDPAVPSPTLLTESDFPPELLVPGSARIRQSAFQFQFGGSMKMNRWFSWTASGGVVQLRHGDPDLSGFPSNRTRPIYSVAPSFQISRHWQLALGYGHRYLAYTPKAVAQTTHMEEFTADLVWMPNDRTRLAFGAYHRDLSPEFLIPDVQNPTGGTFASRIYRKRGNGGTVTITRTLWKNEKAQFDLGYDGTVFGYSHPSQLPFPEFYLNPGVFAPSFYQRHAALVKVVMNPSKHFSWDIHGTVGPQQVKQGSDYSFSSTAGTKLEFPFSPHATLTLGYDYFNTASALQALIVPGRAAAYHSNNVTANLAFRF